MQRGLGSLGLLSLVVLATLVAGGGQDITVTDHAWHVLLIGLANVLAATGGILLLFMFWRSGHAQLALASTALLGFAAVYTWHGVFTGTQPPFQWLIYGPMSRLAVAAILLALVIPQTNYRPAVRPRIVASILVGTGLLAIASWAMGPTLGQVAETASPAQLQATRISLEITAIALITTAAVVATRKGVPIPRWTAAGGALLAIQPVFFIVSGAWDVIWWTAHGIGAAGMSAIALGAVAASSRQEQDSNHQRLEQEAAVRQSFINHAAHALRTPMTALRLQLHIARTTTDPGRQAKALEAAERASDRMHQYSDALLAASTDFNDLDARPVRLDALQVARDVANQAGFGDDATVDGAKAVALMDRELFSKALRHVLENAKKYSKGGPVRISVKRRGRQILVVVEDQGPGFGRESQQTAFLPFAQIDEGRNVEASLAWCRRAMMAQGGNIVIEDGDKTRVTLEVPAAHARKSSVRPSQRAATKKAAAAAAFTPGDRPGHHDPPNRGPLGRG